MYFVTRILRSLGALQNEYEIGQQSQYKPSELSVDDLTKLNGLVRALSVQRLSIVCLALNTACQALSTACSVLSTVCLALSIICLRKYFALDYKLGQKFRSNLSAFGHLR
jgi:hypothetical protein